MLTSFWILPTMEEGHHLLGILAYCIIIFEHLYFQKGKRKKDDS